MWIFISIIFSRGKFTLANGRESYYGIITMAISLYDVYRISLFKISLWYTRCTLSKNIAYSRHMTCTIIKKIIGFSLRNRTKLSSHHFYIKYSRRKSILFNPRSYIDCRVYRDVFYKYLNNLLIVQLIRRRSLIHHRNDWRFNTVNSDNGFFLFFFF